ncbi:MAG TPA: hypothetical protein VH593_15655 [Ktedonobacteraceae bacterium]|jgi:tetratricopeptide (TPR) repeat protein
MEEEQKALRKRRRRGGRRSKRAAAAQQPDEQNKAEPVGETPLEQITDGEIKKRSSIVRQNEANVQNIRRALEDRIEASKKPVSAEHIEQTLQSVEGMPEALQRAEVLFLLAKLLIKQYQWEEALRVIQNISLPTKRDQALLLLKQALSEAQEWEKAMATVQYIKDSALRNRSLRILSTRLVWAQQWNLAEQAVNSIRDSRQHSSAAIRLGEGLAKAGEHQRLLQLVQQAWCRAETREEAIQLLRLAQGLLSQQPDLGRELVQTFNKVDDFLY